MKTSLISIAVVLSVGFTTYSNTIDNQTNSQTGVYNIENPKSENMKNLISIVEIPTTDFFRAVTFYQSLLGVSIEEVNMDGTQMGLLPGGAEAVNVVLVKGNDYKPTRDGVILYLNAGNDLQFTLDKVEENGGQVLVPKTEISPEMGFFALFIDTEGNKLGLHSSN